MASQRIEYLIVEILAHLLEDEDSQQERGRSKRGKKKVMEEQEEEEFHYEQNENGCVLDNYTFGN